jgi:hypothetical protein
MTTRFRILPKRVSHFVIYFKILIYKNHRGTTAAIKWALGAIESGVYDSAYSGEQQ